jgi:hypothetical protein
MKPEINLELFASKIKEKRGHLSFREAAGHIGGITQATVHRVEQMGKCPDLNTFIRICRWLDLPCDTFVVKKIRISAPPQTAYWEAPELSFIEQERLIKEKRMDEQLNKICNPLSGRTIVHEKFICPGTGASCKKSDCIMVKMCSLTGEEPKLTYEEVSYPDDDEPEEPFDKRHMPFADAKRGLEMVDKLQQETVTLGGVPFNFISVPGMEPGKTYFLKPDEKPYTMAITPEGEDEKVPLREKIAVSIDLQQNNEVPNWVKDLMPKEGDDIEIVSENGVITMIISEPDDEPRQCPVTNDQCGQGCLPGEQCCLKKPSGPDDSECTLPDLSDDELTKMNMP